MNIVAKEEFTPDPGGIAYAAYCKAVEYKSFHGEDLLSWEGLTDKIRAGWNAAAVEVMNAHRDGLIEIPGD